VSEHCTQVSVKAFVGKWFYLLANIELSESLGCIAFNSSVTATGGLLSSFAVPSGSSTHFPNSDKLFASHGTKSQSLVLLQSHIVPRWTPSEFFSLHGVRGAPSLSPLSIGKGHGQCHQEPFGWH
jgi:hypothetical protein